MLPIFRSHYSICSSILTLDPSEEIKTNYPVSIFSIAKKHNLAEVFVCDKSMSSFVEAFKNAQNENIKLRYGIELFCCADIEDKSEASLKTEHKIQVWLKDTRSYAQFCKLVTLANTKGFYYQPRIDQKNLTELMNEDIALTIPFYDSFIAQNLLTFSSCSFDCEQFNPIFFEESNCLPFDNIISEGLNSFRDKYEFIKTKTVLYYNRKDIDAFLTLRCKDKRTNWDKPNLNHFSSNEFCFESFLENKND